MDNRFFEEFAGTLLCMGTSEVLVQIDPGRTVCWEQRDTIRIGFDRGHVRIAVPTPVAQQILHSLIEGISERDFAALEHHAGPEALVIRSLVKSLTPVMVRRRRRQSSPPTPLARQQSAIRAQMHDDGRELSGVQDALEAHWLCRFERGPAPPELVVQVLRFLEPLERTRRWLGESIPHLVVRLTDDAIRVGPIVAAHGNPCHACEALHLVDADAALPALAVQLHGKRPGSETAENGQLTGAIAAHMVRAWHQGATWVHTSQLVLPVAQGHVSGLATMHTVQPHPECGCVLGAQVSAESRLPAQTETADADRDRYSQIQTPAVSLSPV